MQSEDFPTGGVTTSVEASFVLRKGRSIALPGPKFGKEKRKTPIESEHGCAPDIRWGLKGGRWRTTDPRAYNIICEANVTNPTPPGDISKKLPEEGSKTLTFELTTQAVTKSSVYEEQ